MPDDDDIAIPFQLIAVNHFAALDSPYRRPLRSGDVDPVMKARSTRTERRIDRAADRP